MRIQALQEDALKRHGCALRQNQVTRDRNLAQAYHVCHMNLHNFFNHQRPKPQNLASDHRTISWSRLSDPNLTWGLIDGWKTNVLVTKDRKPAQLVRTGNSVHWTEPPDQRMSGMVMASFLRAHNVTSMAAPGIDGCCEPCGCGGKASRHITGQACDLHGLDVLERTLHSKSPTVLPDKLLDQYLKSFLLHRPLAHLPRKSRENWHVEPILGTAF
jgi:hypothetical protein